MTWIKALCSFAAVPPSKSSVLGAGCSQLLAVEVVIHQQTSDLPSYSSVGYGLSVIQCRSHPKVQPSEEDVFRSCYLMPQQDKLFVTCCSTLWSANKADNFSAGFSNIPWHLHRRLRCCPSLCMWHWLGVSGKDFSLMSQQQPFFKDALPR